MKNPPFPSVRTCTIQAMLEYTSQMNGKTKQERIQSAIDFALSNIQQLNRVPNLRWSKRKQVIRALDNIDKIGVLESLELLNHKPVEIDAGVNEMSVVAQELGLFLNKVNGRVVITRTPLTIKPAEARSLAEMPVSERGDSSPQLPLV